MPKLAENRSEIGVFHFSIEMKLSHFCKKIFSMAELVEKHLEKAQQMENCKNAKEFKQFIQAIEQEFDISICIKCSPHYSPKFFFDYIRAFLPFTRHEDKDINQQALYFFDLIIPPIITYSPIDFLEGCYDIYKEEQNPLNLCPILRYMSLAINGQIPSVEEKYSPMLLSILSSTSTAEKELLFPFVWQSISKHIDETECDALLVNMMTPEFGEAVANLVSAHPQELVPMVLTKSNFDFLKSFLIHLKTEEPIEIDDFINTLAITNKPELLSAFINSNIQLGKVSLELAKSLCSGLVGDLSDYSSDDQALLLLALGKAVTKGYLEASELQNVIDCKSEFEAFRNASIKILLMNLFPGFQEILDSVYKQRDKTFQYLLTILDKYEESMYNADPNWTKDFIQKVIQVNMQPNQLLQIINNFPTTELIGVEKIVKSFVSTKNQAVAKLIFKITKKYKFQHSLGSLDWILNPQCAYEIIRSPEVPFTLELLQYGMIPPNTLQGMFRSLRLRPRASAPVLYEELLSLAKLLTKPLRVNIDMEDNLPKINWIDMQSINKLFFASRAPFTHTQYGIFNLELIKTLAVLFPHAINCNHMQCIVLMRYLRLFATSFPDTVVPFAIDLYIKYRTETMKALLVLISRENFAPRYSTFVFRMIFELEGIEAALELGKDAMIQAARYDREVAQILATELRQPLEKMKTFLSFVSIGHHIPWARECAKAYPVSEWMLKEGDGPLLIALAECNDAEVKKRVEEAKVIVEKLQESDETKPAEEERTYKFDYNIDVYQAPECRAAEPATLANLISFLWHAKTQLPRENEKEMIDFLYKVKDDKLLLGALCYCERYVIKLDEEIIAKRIRASNDIQTASAYVFFKSIRCVYDKMPEHIANAVDRVLDDMRVPKSDLFEAARTHRIYPQRAVLNAIVNMDKNMSEKIMSEEPVKTSDFGSVDQCKVALATIFSLMKSDDFTEPNQLLPSNYNWPNDFLMIGREKKHYVAASIPEASRSWVFTAAKKKDSMAFYLKFIDPTEQETEKLKEYVIKHTFPAVLFKDKTEIDYEIEDEYQFYTPSFSRTFYRSLFARCAKPLPQRLVDSIMKVLPTVPPMTLPKNSSFILRYDETFKDTDCIIDVTNGGDLTNLSTVYQNALNGDVESLHCLVNAPRSEVMQRLDLSDVAIAVSEASRSVITEGAKSGILAAFKAFEVASSKLSFAEIVAIICNKRFIISKDIRCFLSMAILFRLAEVKAKGTDYEPMFVCFREMSEALFTNKKFQEFFAKEVVDAKELSYLLHELPLR